MRASQYEKLGIRLLYRLTAGSAGEALLPASDARENLPFAGAMRRRMAMSRYTEGTNWVRFIILLPVIWGAIAIHAAWLVVYVSLLALTHVVAILCERYKRALCEELLPFAVEGETPQPVLGPFKDTWYYRPKRWESMQLYVCLGVTLTQKWILDFAEHYQYDRKHRGTKEKVTTLEQPSRKELDQFERSTRVSENFHLIGIALDSVMVVPFMFLHMGLLVTWTVLIVIFDLECLMLQRYHRVRVWKLVQKVRAKSFAGDKS
jgi:hypothetical protein